MALGCDLSYMTLPNLHNIYLNVNVILLRYIVCGDPRGNMGVRSPHSG